MPTGEAGPARSRLPRDYRHEVPRTVSHEVAAQHSKTPSTPIFLGNSWGGESVRSHAAQHSFSPLGCGLFVFRTV